VAGTGARGKAAGCTRRSAHPSCLTAFRGSAPAQRGRLTDSPPPRPGVGDRGRVVAIGAIPVGSRGGAVPVVGPREVGSSAVSRAGTAPGGSMTAVGMSAPVAWKVKAVGTKVASALRAVWVSRRKRSREPPPSSRARSSRRPAQELPRPRIPRALQTHRCRPPTPPRQATRPRSAPRRRALWPRRSASPMGAMERLACRGARSRSARARALGASAPTLPASLRPLGPRV
jgi:hypothetical protein